MNDKKFDGKCFFNARELDIIAFALDQQTSNLLSKYRDTMVVYSLPSVIKELKPYTELRNKIANYQNKLNGTN